MATTIAQFIKASSKAQLMETARDLAALYPGLPASLGLDPTVDLLRKLLTGILTESEEARGIVGVATSVDALCNLDGLVANGERGTPTGRTTAQETASTSTKGSPQQNTQAFDPLRAGSSKGAEVQGTPPRTEEQQNVRGDARRDGQPEETPETWLNRIYAQYNRQRGQGEPHPETVQVPVDVLDTYERLLQGGHRPGGSRLTRQHEQVRLQESQAQVDPAAVEYWTRKLGQIDAEGSTGGSRTLRFLKDARQRGIKFTGLVNESARTFIRKFEELARLHNLSEGDRRLAIADLLEGPVERHYRVSQHLWPTWASFRDGFLGCYAQKTTDAQILKNITQRSQHSSERPHLYIAAVRAMAEELIHPIPDHSLLQIIKDNLLPKYSSQLALFNTPDFVALESACSVIERSQLTAQQFQPPPTYLLQDPDFGCQIQTQEKKQVAELTGEEQIMAVTENCYNCNGPHRYKQCSQPLKIFCRFCGRKEVTTAMCCRKRLAQPRSGETQHTATPGTSSQQAKRQDEFTELKKLVLEMHAHFAKIPKNG